jgi:hypothetical protein
MTSLGVLLLLAAAGTATPPPGDRAAEEWPIEYVLRPQTDPAGWVRAAAWGSAYVPTDIVTTPMGRLGNLYAASASVSVGLTARVDVRVSLPDLYCHAGNLQSYCDNRSTMGGAGMAVGIGVVRRRAVQVLLLPEVSMEYTQAPAYRLAMSGRLKWLAHQRVALELGLGARKTFPEEVAPLRATFIHAEGMAAFQATRHLLLSAALAASAATEGMDRPDLRLIGGPWWTFSNGVQVGASVASPHLLARRPTNNYVNGASLVLNLSLWL